jgi:hypothetical protein
LATPFAIMNLPEVAVSRDGQRGVLVTSFDGEWRGVSNRDASAQDAQVRVSPRLPLSTIMLVVTGQLRTFWDMPRQTQRWPESFSTAFPELAAAAIGEYLDDAPQPEQPGPDHYAAVVSITTDLFDLFRREPEQDDAKLLRYIGGKLYWGYRLGADTIQFGRHDALRFGVAVDDLHRVAWQSNGLLWDRAIAGGYRALPRLLTDFRAGILPGQERTLIEQIEPLIDRQRYPAAAFHISKAIGFLRGSNVDLENAAKEAVNAVESVAKTLLNAPSATLGDCIKEFRKRDLIPREMARILESVYAYRNTTPGVGHGCTNVPNVSPADATFVLGVASVAIGYLDALWPSLRLPLGHVE